MGDDDQLRLALLHQRGDMVDAVLDNHWPLLLHLHLARHLSICLTSSMKISRFQGVNAVVH